MARKSKLVDVKTETLQCTCGNRFFVAVQLLNLHAPEPTPGRSEALPEWCPGCGSIWTWEDGGGEVNGRWVRALVGQNLLALRKLSNMEAAV